MDPIANMDEQLLLAQEIIAAHESADNVVSADDAARLAELVIALHNWRAGGGGFDPYQYRNGRLSAKVRR